MERLGQLGLSHSVISEPFHVVSPEGLADFFFCGGSGFQRAQNPSGRPQSGTASAFYQSSKLQPTFSVEGGFTPECEH